MIVILIVYIMSVRIDQRNCWGIGHKRVSIECRQEPFDSLSKLVLSYCFSTLILLLARIP